MLVTLHCQTSLYLCALSLFILFLLTVPLQVASSHPHVLIIEVTLLI